MTDCLHLNSGTLSSRPEGHSQAKRMGFRYLYVRKRECPDCGLRFRTFELTEPQLGDFGRAFFPEARQKLLDAYEAVFNWKP